MIDISVIVHSYYHERYIAQVLGRGLLSPILEANTT